MRLVISSLACCLLLAACGGSQQSDDEDSGDGSSGARVEHAVSAAVLKKDINLAGCLNEESEDAATAGSCPTYILQSLDYMIQECSRVGGELQPLPESAAWSLDVNSDGNAEVLLDLTQNFTCQGAPSVFSCGSLGCPYFLYIQDGDDWNELGAISADDAPGIEVLTSKAKDIPATLRGGCTGQRPCSELTQYTWNGTAYDRSLILFRGFKVDVAPGGLWTLRTHERRPGARRADQGRRSAGSVSDRHDRRGSRRLAQRPLQVRFTVQRLPPRFHGRVRPQKIVTTNLVPVHRFVVVAARKLRTCAPAPN